MRVGPIAHGALLVAALGFAYQTWTRDKSETPKVGTVTVWDEAVSDFEAFAYDGENKSVRVERRGDGGDSYYWGQVTRTEAKKKPKVPVKGGANDGDPGSPGAAPGHGPGMAPGGRPGMPPGVRPGMPPGGRPGMPPGGRPPGAVPPGSGAAPAGGAKPPEPAKAGGAKPPEPAKAGGGPGPKTPQAARSPHQAGTDQPQKPAAAPPKPAGAAPSGDQGSPAKPAAPAGDKGSSPAKPAAPAGDKGGPARPAAPAGAAPAAGGSAPAGDPGDPGSAGEDTADEDDDGGASTPAALPDPTTAKTKEFPIGKGGKALIENLAHLHALRDLGVLTDKQKEEYDLTDSKENLTVFFKGGKQHSLIIGSRVFGAGDRYVLNSETGKGYVLSNSEIMRHVDGAESSLGLKGLHEFQDEIQQDSPGTPDDPNLPKAKRDRYPNVASVEVETPSGSRSLVRYEEPDPGSGNTIIGWADKNKPKEADVTFGNLLAQIERIRPLDYDTSLDPSTLTKVMTLRYVTSGGKPVGTFELYKKEAAVTPELEPSEESKKGNEAEYYVKTELTRVLGKVGRMTAERIADDLPQLFGAPPKAREPRKVLHEPGAVPEADPGKTAPKPGADNHAPPAPDKTVPGKTNDKSAGSKPNPTEGNK
ncbi:MAG TPA: hypothetical protein VK698_04130 [Kofleriaceae bacterium]|nr:hypothetical protein [Kofleriaceae bacterium]